MYHIVLVGLACVLLLLSWNLVHYSPRVLSMILPRALTFGIGLGLFVLAIFSAFTAAHVLREPLVMLQSFVQGYVGLWFMLATTAGLRGSYSDEQMLRRLFAMMALVMTVIIASLYIGDSRLLAIVNLLLIGAGLWITTNYLRFLDRGR